jgi:ElaA protein
MSFLPPLDPLAFRMAYPRGDELPVIVRWVASEEELEKAFQVRREVFVEEQGYTEEQEFVEEDSRAYHALAVTTHKVPSTPGVGRPVGAGRLMVEGRTANLGRVAVARHARRTGVGTAIVRLLLDEASDRGCTEARAGVQVVARSFWTRQGFVSTSERYMDFHIEHEWMSRTVEQPVMLL